MWFLGKPCFHLSSVMKETGARNGRESMKSSEGTRERKTEKKREPDVPPMLPKVDSATVYSFMCVFSCMKRCSQNKCLLPLWSRSDDFISLSSMGTHGLHVKHTKLCVCVCVFWLWQRSCVIAPRHRSLLGKHGIAAAHARWTDWELVERWRPAGEREEVKVLFHDRCLSEA